MRRVLLTAGVAAVSLLAAGCASSATGASNSGSAPVVLRLGFLANITHEPALVGLAKGFFTKDLGKNVTLKTTVLDPQGKTIQGALKKMNYKGVEDVRQG